MAPLVGLVHLVVNRFCPPGNPMKAILLMVGIFIFEKLHVITFFTTAV